MGWQARLRKARREARVQETRNQPVGRGEPLRVLKAIHRTIQDHCHESGRRCWEYLLEMIAHSSGWETDTAEAKHLWDKMANETRWQEFYESWIAEVEWAHRNRGPFSEPLGELLEHIEGTNEHLGQFMTPMAVVRMINQITLSEGYEPPQENGTPSRRTLDPCVGTGRFLIDALVHDDGLLAHGVDVDLWMLRCAMLNVRLLAKWTSLRIRNPDDRLRPLKQRLLNPDLSAPVSQMIASARVLSVNPDLPTGDTLLIGGRSIFMNGDALIVDLNYTPNWLCAGWHWAPRPWRDNLKIAGYPGTYNQWIEDGRPERFAEPAPEVRFDYSMVDKTAPPAQRGPP